jgi:hypothetical protein
MYRLRPVGIALLLLLLLLAAGAALAAGTPAITRHVIAGGGGTVSAGEYSLRATIGQGITGQALSGSYDLCAGFWCGLARYEIFLPLVLRQ